MNYIPWASAWGIVKHYYPDATFHVYEQTIDESGTKRPWFDDGRTGWVKVSVTIGEDMLTETLAIMNYKNEAVTADKITSCDANKAIKRCLAKALALHGLGLYVYEGEDIPDDEKKINEMQENIAPLIKKKCALSDSAKAQVEKLCKEAEKSVFPEIEDEYITGNPKKINDVEVLETLYKKLLGVRK